MEKKNKIILHKRKRTGPTASGKTSIAIELSERIQNSEILSVDSRQFYRRDGHWNWGLDYTVYSLHWKSELCDSACLTHHFIDIADPSIDYSVINALGLLWGSLEYARRAREIIRVFYCYYISGMPCPS